MRRAVLLTLLACHHGSSAPPTTTCAVVSDHVYSMLPQDDHGKSVRDVFAGRCAKDNWAVDTRSCIMSTKTLHDGHHCKDHLTPEQRTAFELDLEAVEKQRASLLPPECERYRLIIQKLASCDKMPMAARDAMKQGFDAMTQAWASSTGIDAKRAMAMGCQQGYEATLQSGKAICGW